MGVAAGVPPQLSFFRERAGRMTESSLPRSALVGQERKRKVIQAPNYLTPTSLLPCSCLGPALVLPWSCLGPALPLPYFTP